MTRETRGAHGFIIANFYEIIGDTIASLNKDLAHFTGIRRPLMLGTVLSRNQEDRDNVARRTLWPQHCVSTKLSQPPHTIQSKAT